MNAEKIDEIDIMEPVLIRVGIPTKGAPETVLLPDGKTLLKNMVIGLGFHWERVTEAILPGKIMLTDDPVYSIVNILPLETYLECVVGSEMNPEAPSEFMKAHAVISRGWAMGKILSQHHADVIGKKNESMELIDWEDTHDHTGFDVCSDDHCQRYQGEQKIPQEVLTAIRATAGLVLYSASGSLVDTRFSKCCGGVTELFSTCWQDVDPECLVSKKDPWCDLSKMPEDEKCTLLNTILKDYDLLNEGGFFWDEKISANDIRKNLFTKFKRDIGEIKALEIVDRGPSGRAKRLRLKGSEGELTIGKELMIRRLLAPTHLYSSKIFISGPDLQGNYLLSGRGWGHGVGLCQIGAAHMAMEGYSYKEILQFYYPGSHLQSVNTIIEPDKIIS